MGTDLGVIHRAGRRAQREQSAVQRSVTRAQVHQTDLVRHPPGRCGPQRACHGGRGAKPDGGDGDAAPGKTSPAQIPPGRTDRVALSAVQMHGAGRDLAQPEGHPLRHLSGHRRLAQKDNEQLLATVGNGRRHEGVREAIRQRAPGFGAGQAPGVGALLSLSDDSGARRTGRVDAPGRTGGIPAGRLFGASGLRDDGERIKVGFDDPCHAEVQTSDRGQCRQDRPRGLPDHRPESGKLTCDHQGLVDIWTARGNPASHVWIDPGRRIPG